MAAVQPGVWGIDIGQFALKALRLEKIDGQVTATAFDYVEHPKILNQQDADPDQLTHEALEKFLSRNPLKGDRVAMSVPGQSGLARFVKLPPVEEKKITDIVKFEAKQQIPFNLNEVVWDYQKIGSGVITDGFAMETEIGLFAIKRDTVNKFLKHFQDVGVEVHFVQMAPLALCNFVSYDLLNMEGTAVEQEDDAAAKKRDCVAALDIGTDNSNLVITDGGRIIWQRPIPFGGNHFTRALVKDMKLTFAKAEHLKRNATKSPDLKKILMALRPVLNDFVNEVQRSLGFFTNTHREVNLQYLIGLGNAFRLPGLQKFLGEKLQLEVRKLQSFSRLEGDSVVSAPVFSENVLSFATSYGLALQGLKLPRLQTNLLPQEIQVERMIRSKKPMAVAAAACLLVGTAALAFGYSREHRAVAAPIIRQAMEKGQRAIREANEWKTKCELKEKENNELDKEVKSVLAGQDERENWIQLNKFLNDCLPRTDGQNLTDAQKKLYWSDPATGEVKGKIAWDKFWAKQSGQKGDVRTDDEEILEDLIQVNIEAVNCQFTSDLEKVFKGHHFTNTLKGRKPTGMHEDLTKDPPKGPGWLVEIRGYTYHKNRDIFILETLLENLYTMSKAPEKPEAKAKPAEGEPAEGKVDPKAEKNKTAEPKEDAKPEEKAADKSKPPIENPIAGKISHVFLAHSKAVENPDPVRFQLINRSALSELIGIAAPKKDGENIALDPAIEAVVAPRRGWKSIGGVGTEEKGTGSVLSSAAEENKPRDPNKKPEPTRTEFILIFVWREPTPSDELRRKAIATAAAETAAAPEGQEPPKQ